MSSPQSYCGKYSWETCPASPSELQLSHLPWASFQSKHDRKVLAVFSRDGWSVSFGTFCGCPPIMSFVNWLGSDRGHTAPSRGCYARLRLGFVGCRGRVGSRSLERGRLGPSFFRLEVRSVPGIHVSLKCPDFRYPSPASRDSCHPPYPYARCRASTCQPIPLTRSSWSNGRARWVSGACVSSLHF